jgi:hypothetical protein
MKRLAVATLASTAALAFLGAALASPEFDLARDEDRTKLATIEREAKDGNDASIYSLDEVFSQVARLAPQRDAKNPPGDMLLEPAPPGGPAGRESPQAAPWTAPDGSAGITMRSLRALAFDVARRLPPAMRKKLVDAQRDAEASEKKRGNDDEEVLLRRFPLAPDACVAAWKLADRASEAGDEGVALAWDRLAARLAALQPQPSDAPPSAFFRRAIMLVRAGDLDGAEALARRYEAQTGASAALVALVRERLSHARLQREALDARRPPEGLIPDLIASYQFNRADSASAVPVVMAPPVAAHVGDVVFASDGSRLLAVDARSGELRARLPQNDDKIVPPPTTIPGYVSAQGELVVTPLFYETMPFLPTRGTGSARANRSDLDDADASVRGGFFSLFAYDAAALRLLWWDGDKGTSPRAATDDPGSRPPGMEAVDERTWRALMRAHVMGKPLVDGRRVYIALGTSMSESNLWIAAYERRTGDGGSLGMTLVWRRFISLSPQPVSNQVQNSVPPLMNPRLALDPEGRVIFQTDQGVVGAIDVRAGDLEWVRRPNDEDARTQRAQQRAAYRPTSDPPVIFAGDGTRPSIAVVASPDDECWLGVSCEDGSVLWRSEVWTQPRSGYFSPNRPESPRALALSATAVLGYGGQGFVALDPVTGASLLDPTRTRFVHLDDNERPAGAAALAGNGMALIATDQQQKLRKLVFHEETVRSGRRVELSLGERLAFQGIGDQPQVHLLALEGRVVATTPARVLVYSWVPRSD